jgi:hypothetical protein
MMRQPALADALISPGNNEALPSRTVVDAANIRDIRVSRCV